MRTARAGIVAAGLAFVLTSGALAAESGQSDPSQVDLGQRSQLAGSGRRSREVRIQLMMIDIINVIVRGTFAAGRAPLPPSVGGVFARIWNLLAHPTGGSLASIVTRDAPPVSGLWLPPRTWGGGQGVTRAARVHAYMTSLAGC